MVELDIATAEYEHLRPVLDGRIGVEGIELNPVLLPHEEIFFRFIRFKEWHVSELGLAPFAALVSQGAAPGVGIPVFPCRLFRHSAVYIRHGGSVETPQDLSGKRVGVPEWGQTAAVWARGMLADEYGISIQDIEWVQAGTNQVGRRDKVRPNLPPGITYSPQPDRTLNDLLVAGEIDAVISGQAPAGFKDGGGRVARLFDPGVNDVERDYWSRTRIFPIMHLIVVRNDVMASHPWVAMNLLKAFDRSRLDTLERVESDLHPFLPIPWLADYAREFSSGQSWPTWTYGLEGNRRTLDVFLEWCYGQGVLDRRLGAEELFAPNVSEEARS